MSSNTYPAELNSGPSHGHPSKKSSTEPTTLRPNTDDSTASHPPTTKPDPTIHHGDQATATRGKSTTSTSATQLSKLTLKLRSALRQYPDFPSPGILFEDIMPLFASPELHGDLIDALYMLVTQQVTSKPIDVVVGLESRGFLFGPTLAMRLGAAFVPVRKQGKLPGPCETESFQKEYGADHFQMQSDAIKPGQRVLIVDDIIATGEYTLFLGSSETLLTDKFA